MCHEQQLPKTRSIGPGSSSLWLIVFTLVVLLVSCTLSPLAAAAPTGKASTGVKDSSCSNGVCTCTGGALPNGDGTNDLVINTGTCVASAGLYQYKNVNIYGGGELMFMDNGNTHFWATSILIENTGKLTAGTSDVPYGANGTLTIHLYGADQGVAGKGGAGITCQADNQNHCGIPDAVWNSNPGMKLNPTTCNLSSLPGGTFNSGTWSNPVSDCFYSYMPLDYDGGTSGTPPRWATSGIRCWRYRTAERCNCSAAKAR